MSAAAYLNLRVFIEGIEVPAIGARIVATAGSPMSCELQLVATDPIYDIKPRSAVAVCVYDDERIGHRYANGEQSVRPNLAPGDLRNYKVAFLGEISGISFQKNPGQRDATFICLSPDNYWDFIKQSSVNFRNGGIELAELAFQGVSSGKAQVFNVAGKDLHSNLSSWLTAEKNAQGKASLYLGVHRTIREMWFAANDWYGAAFNRWRYGDLVVGIKEDETAAKLLEMGPLLKYLSNRIGGAGGQYTMGQLLQLLMGTAFHEVVGIPFPRLDYKGSVRGYKKDSTAAYMGGLTERAPGWKDATLNYSVLKPNAPFIAPPACNILFPNQYGIMTLNRQYLAEPTRLFVRSGLLAGGGASRLLTERFYAPNFQSIGKMNLGDGAFLERLASLVMPHEKFTGLNAIEHWQDDLSAYVAKGPRRKYLTQLADYQFWLARFGPRTMSFDGPLNMNLVPGYPCVLMADAYSPLHLSKHVLGQLHTLTHVIDQRGGFTQGTVTHVHHHAEVLDFDVDTSEKDDGTGASYRSLEELVNTATDGFLDDRYDTTRIGKEVYQPLFGCGSLYDLAAELDPQVDRAGAASKIPLVVNGTKVWADIAGEKHALRKAIWTLELVWRQTLKDGQDLRDLSRQATWRPKASLVEILGWPSALVSANELDGDFRKVYRADGIPEEGFLASAFDPQSYAATTGDKYQRITYTYTKKVKLGHRLLLPGEAGVDDAGNRVVGSGSGTQITTSTTDTIAHEHRTTVSYGLQIDGLSRRQAVQDYVDSLAYRGLG
jgi:hypothetical protein